MTWLVVTSILLSVLGIGLATWQRKTLPDSVSALVYDLPKGRQWVWTVMLALMMGTLGAYNDTEEPAVADGKGLLVAEVICAVSVFGALLT